MEPETKLLISPCIEYSSTIEGIVTQAEPSQPIVKLGSEDDVKSEIALEGLN
jgi:hypothetical protein